jgi:hypothetical protein
VWENCVILRMLSRIFLDRPFSRRLLLSRLPAMLDSTGPPENITRLTIQGTTQLFQYVCTIHSGTLVIEPEQSRVGDAGLFSQTINRPALLVKDFDKLAYDHGRNLSGPLALCQLSHIYEVYFTYERNRSRVAPRSRGRGLGVQWKTAATNLCMGISKTFPGHLSTALGGRS